MIKIRMLRPVGCFALGLAVVAQVGFGADLQVSGNLSVTGDADIEGQVLSLGADGGFPSSPLFSLQGTLQTGTLTIDQLAFMQDTVRWAWSTSGTPAPQPGMVLERKAVPATQKLSLFSYDGTQAGVVLDPSGPSILHSLQAAADGSELPLQTLATEHRIVTRNLGDARYWRRDGQGVALGGSSVVGSIAIGTGSSVDSEGAVALGFSGTVQGTGSIGIGHQSQTAGNQAIAIGPGTVSSSFSVALGTGANASGGASIAIGQGAVALKDGQIVLGRFNEHEAAGLEDPLDALFMIGNGTSNVDRSNAMVVRRNGNVEIGGLVQTPALSAAQVEVTGVLTAQELEVQSSSALGGTTTINHKLVVPAGAKMLVAPQGDLGMGLFTNGEKPPGVP